MKLSIKHTVLEILCSDMEHLPKSKSFLSFHKYLKNTINYTSIYLASISNFKGTAPYNQSVTPKTIFNLSKLVVSASILRLGKDEPIANDELFNALCQYIYVLPEASITNDWSWIKPNKSFAEYYKNLIKPKLEGNIKQRTKLEMANLSRIVIADAYTKLIDTSKGKILKRGDIPIELQPKFIRKLLKEIKQYCCEDMLIYGYCFTCNAYFNSDKTNTNNTKEIIAYINDHELINYSFENDVINLINMITNQVNNCSISPDNKQWEYEVAFPSWIELSQERNIIRKVTRNNKPRIEPINEETQTETIRRIFNAIKEYNENLPKNTPILSYPAANDLTIISGITASSAYKELNKLRNN